MFTSSCAPAAENHITPGQRSVNGRINVCCIVPRLRLQLNVILQQFSAVSLTCFPTIVPLLYVLVESEKALHSEVIFTMVELSFEEMN